MMMMMMIWALGRRKSSSSSSSSSRATCSAAWAQSSPNITWAAMGLRADPARPQRVSGSARTDSRRAQSARNARNPIASHVKLGNDCANADPGLSQWTAVFILFMVPSRKKIVHIDSTNLRLWVPLVHAAAVQCSHIPRPCRKLTIAQCRFSYAPISMHNTYATNSNKSAYTVRHSNNEKQVTLTFAGPSHP